MQEQELTFNNVEMPEMQHSEKIDNILEAIAEVSDKVGFISPTGYNSFQKYRFVSEKDLLSALAKLLNENNLVPIFSEKGQKYERDEKNNVLHTVTMSLTVFHKPSGEYIRIFGSGTGHDTLDKAVFKAITGCKKYLYRDLFVIPCGEDPEADGTSKELEETISKIGSKKISASHAVPKLQMPMSPVVPKLATSPDVPTTPASKLAQTMPKELTDKDIEEMSEQVERELKENEFKAAEEVIVKKEITKKSKDKEPKATKMDQIITGELFFISLDIKNPMIKLDQGFGEMKTGVITDRNIDNVDCYLISDKEAAKAIGSGTTEKEIQELRTDFLKSKMKKTTDLKTTDNEKSELEKEEEITKLKKTQEINKEKAVDAMIVEVEEVFDSVSLTPEINSRVAIAKERIKDDPSIALAFIEKIRTDKNINYMNDKQREFVANDLQEFYNSLN